MSQTGAVCASGYTVSGNLTDRFVRVTINGGGAPGLVSLSFVSAPEVDASDSQVPALPPVDPSAPVVVMESCDLWSSEAMWRSVLSVAPYNQPLTGPYGGFYDDTEPATASARIALARKAGVTAFQSCWYRQAGNAGQPVVTSFDGIARALADLSTVRSGVSWSIYWDNDSGVDGGVSGLPDFLQNLVPFWINSYFSRPNFLRVDGKPVIVIADADTLSKQLGGRTAAAIGIAQFRAQVAAAGLPGVVILGANNGSSRATNATASAIGFDGIMNYSTPAFVNTLTTPTPTGDQLVTAEKQSWADWAAYSVLPTTLTVSMGYDSTIWSSGTFKFLMSPSQLGGLLGDAISQAKAAPPTSLRHRLIYVDNWNEYGEGRFIEPSAAYGGSYLNAVSQVLCPNCSFSYSPASGVLSPASN